MQSLHETFEVGGSVIYGRADDVNRIIDLLSTADGTDFSSTFVSIVADRGTGRTTLLHILHNALCSAFDQRKFICMPEKYDERRLMRVIIESLTGTPCDITDLEILEEMMKEELMDQRLLLLLDNFDDKNQNCWDLLSALLKVCKEKSAVVVTTTRKAVAEVKGPMQFYYMNNLSDKWCSMIFKQCVFNDQIPDADTKLADVGKRLVAKCRNVTLCIKVLSNLLRHSITVDWWGVVLDNKFWEMDDVEGDILPALRVCYEYLPFHLQQCLKYCSLFPKEYLFSKQYLLYMWLSQGFIEPGEGREIEDIGLEYFDQLLFQSFFQPSLFPDMKEEKFVMPGLIHDLMQQLSDECFQFEGCMQRAPESICHLSLIAHEFQLVSLNHLITRAENLRSLLVLSRSVFQHHISSCVINLVELDALFVKFHSLVTLNLNNTDIEELPEMFGSLFNLRYLSLSGTNIRRIPMGISNLIHLQTLEAKECHYLEELPRTIEALTNLRYLDVTKEVGSVVMPRGIGKLTNLRSLGTFNVGMDALLHCGIEELKFMEHLKGCLEISGLINVRSGIDAKKSCMRSKKHIHSLFLHWSDEKTFLGDEGTEIAQEVLESLYPTDNLKEIIIKDYPGNNFPIWVEGAHFSRLSSIVFDHCYNCERLPELGRLPSLKFLSIRKMYSVQIMNLSYLERSPNNSTRYPSLMQLTIWEMYELVDWVEIGNQDFPVLQSLCIKSCPLLRNVPKFPALVELSVYSSEQFLGALNLQSLQSLRIEGLLKTKLIKLSKGLGGLKKLKISRCPETLSIEGLPLLNSLETVIISRCPQLDTHDILYGQPFEERGNSSVWFCKKKLALSEPDFGLPGLCDEGLDHPIVLQKRKDREDLSSFSGVLAEKPKKVKELESHTSEEDQDLLEKKPVEMNRLLTILSEGEDEMRQLSSHLNEQLRADAMNVQGRFSQAIAIVSSMEATGMHQMPSQVHMAASGSPGGSFSGSPSEGSERIFKKSSMEVTSMHQMPSQGHTAASDSLEGSFIDNPSEGTERIVQKRKGTVKRTINVEGTVPDDGRPDTALVPDDGFSWRKYGEKHILNAKYPRSYYRCTFRNNQNCEALKNVQRSNEDPTIFVVTYQGEHTCTQHVGKTQSFEHQRLIPIQNESDEHVMINFNNSNIPIGKIRRRRTD